MKKKEIKQKMIELLGDLSDAYNEHEYRNAHQYFGDIDELAVRAQDLLEEIENA